MRPDADVGGAEPIAAGEIRRRLRANPELIVVQSRLLSPRYAGPGKWAIFDPRTLRSFVAATPDNTRMPAVLRLLARAATGDAAEAVAAALPGATEATIDRLEDQRLLVDAEITTPRVHGFLGHYQLAVFDFPFLDYSVETWREQDAGIMASYSAESPHPAVFTPLDGPSIPLPAPNLEALAPGRPELETLAAALHVAFAPTGSMDGGGFGPWLQKTSPSGGARHPSDGVLVLGDRLGGMAAGQYAYDARHHALVPVTSTGATRSLAARARVAIALRTRVERAMWRYRDLRALRPVLLDAGHVLETLSAVLQFAGWKPQLEYAREGPADLSGRWLKEPVLAAVTDASQARPREDEPVAAPPSDGHHEGSLRTNPAAYIHLRDGHLTAESVWPQSSATQISEAELLVLTHCLPSRRDDRDVTRSGILTAAPGLDEFSIDRLAAAGALLPAPAVAALERSLALWVEHGWYLCALAVLVGRAQGREPPPRVAWPPLFGERGELLDALYTRRTSRRFAPEALPRDALERVLEALPASALDDVTVRVAALDVNGLASGVYGWTTDARLSSLGLLATREDVRRWSIGQPWTGDGGAAVWLVRELDPDAPPRYEPDLMDLGRLAQRLCLAAVAAGVAVFLTPAVSDAALFAAIQIDEPEFAVAYAFTLGARAS